MMPCGIVTYEETGDTAEFVDIIVVVIRNVRHMFLN